MGSQDPHKPILKRLFPPWTWAVNARLLALAIAAAVAVGVLSAVVVMHHYLSLDATVQRDIQGTNLGPLTLTFPFFSWLGGPGGIYMQVVVIVLTCIARVWAGAHWPSDVIGGVLLGIGWSAFVLWLPERWLPSPTFRWVRGTRTRPS